MYEYDVTRKLQEAVEKLCAYLSWHLSKEFHHKSKVILKPSQRTVSLAD
jgi:hypothetical protein